MSRYSNARIDYAAPTTWANYGKSARRRVRELKRLEAEKRNAATPPERRRCFRREQARARAVLTPDERARLSAALAEPQPTEGAA